MFFASLGFSLIIGTKSKFYIACACLAAICYYTSVIFLRFFNSIIGVSFVCACILSILSQIFAKKAKAPATIFLLPSILPLVPGSRFFYAISSALAQNAEKSIMYFLQTLEYTAGISTGIMLGSSLCKIIFAVKSK